MSDRVGLWALFKLPLPHLNPSCLMLPSVLSNFHSHPLCTQFPHTLHSAGLKTMTAWYCHFLAAGRCVCAWVKCCCRYGGGWQLNLCLSECISGLHDHSTPSSLLRCIYDPARINHRAVTLVFQASTLSPCPSPSLSSPPTPTPTPLHEFDLTVLLPQTAAAPTAPHAPIPL